MGGHTQRCSEPRGPRSQRTSRELHENNEQSLAHRPYRRKEPSARALQIPHHRATPHSSTGKAPAEVLFNRPFQVRLPQKNEPAQDPVLSQRNLEAKAKQKTYKDAKTNTKPHNIKVGDQVLIYSRNNPNQTHDMTQSHVKLLTPKEHSSTRSQDPKTGCSTIQSHHQPSPQAVWRSSIPPQPTVPNEDTSTFDWTPTTETTPKLPNQPINPIPPHQYPNGHLDPNINRPATKSTSETPPNRYNPQNGR